MSTKLTAGSLARLRYAELDEEETFPSLYTLQLVLIKKILNPSYEGVDRYRCMISDGEHFMQAMLTDELNEMVRNDTLRRYTVVLVDGMFFKWVMPERRLLFVSSLRIVEHLDIKIEEPESIYGIELPPPTLDSNKITNSLTSSSPGGNPVIQETKTNPSSPRPLGKERQSVLRLERNSGIAKDTNVSMITYNFTPLNSLQNLPKDAKCHVIGVVKEASPISEVISKQSRPVSKRELTVTDKSGFCVCLTLWGKLAEQYVVDTRPVIAFKGVRVGDLGTSTGRSLSMLSSSTMEVNPVMDECLSLRD